MNIIKPSKLKKGDTIGILATSGAIEQDEKPIAEAVQFFEQNGYKTLVSEDVYKKDRYLAGDDKMRLKNLHDFFENDEINAIICLRGGYGALRLIEKIDYNLIRNNPKIFCGFSDITALNLIFYKKSGLLTFSGPMILSDFGSPERSEYTMNSFFKAVSTEPYSLNGTSTINDGNAGGILWGGNLSTTVSLCGQDFIPDEPFIFFAEDVCEPVYKIDKMFRQLINIEKFRKNLRGICFGEFTKTDNEDWLSELFNELIEELEVPAACGFAFSHNSKKATVPIGGKARLISKTLFID